MFRIGARAAVLLVGAIFTASVFCSRASADFNQKFPGKGSYKLWSSAADLISAAASAEARSDYSTAEELYRKSIRMYPYDASAYYDLGLLLDQRKRYKEAEPLLRKSIELQPVFQNWDELGIGLARQGRLDEAKRALSNARGFAKSQNDKQALDQDERALKTLMQRGSR